MNLSRCPKEVPKQCRSIWRHYYQLLVENSLWHEGKIDKLINFCFITLMLKKQREFIIEKNMSLMEEVPYMMSCGPETTLKESESSKIYRRLLEKHTALYKTLELDKIKYESVDTGKDVMEGLLDAVQH